ncbi:MAG: hypothetical protein HY986_12395 [Candidatus Melainabacteria bacterium]|nr:hypothetical protein [Candidatus Melainabacteria bacterium]
MDKNWGVQDSDWQLRKLQQDSLRTSDRVLAASFAVLQQEVAQVFEEYQRNFGPNSAQFAEYVTMLMLKLQSAGLATMTCMEWLSNATSGVLPAAHPNAPYATQAQTLKHIPEEFRAEMDPGQHFVLSAQPPAFPADDEFNSRAVDALIAGQTAAPVPAANSAPAFSNPWGEAPQSDAPATPKSGLNSFMPTTWENGSQVNSTFRISQSNMPVAPVQQAQPPVQQAVSQPANYEAVRPAESYSNAFQNQPVGGQPAWGVPSQPENSGLPAGLPHNMPHNASPQTVPEPQFRTQAGSPTSEWAKQQQISQQFQTPSQPPFTDQPRAATPPSPWGSPTANSAPASPQTATNSRQNMPSLPPSGYGQQAPQIPPPGPFANIPQQSVNINQGWQQAATPAHADNRQSQEQSAAQAENQSQSQPQNQSSNQSEDYEYNPATAWD